MVCMLLRAGANLDIASSDNSTARQIAQRRGHVGIIVAIDRRKCRSSLVEMCVGLCAADFPVLVVLEIHEALCKLYGLHEVELRDEKERRSLEGHLKESVSWEIAKKVKHFLDYE